MQVGRRRESGEGEARSERISYAALQELAPDAQERLHRQVVLSATGLATALTLVYCVLDTMKGEDSFHRLLIPALSIFLGGLFAISWRGHVKRAEHGLFLVGGGVLLERIYFVRHAGLPGQQPILDVYELLVWFPGLFLFGFLLFERRHAAVYSLAMIVGSLWIVRDWVIPGADAIFYSDLTEFYIALTGTVAIAAAFSFLKERFLATHRLAVDLQSFAETDFLTEVPNRRGLQHVLEREVQRARRAGSALGVILLDIDHFKRVNDDFGHAEGDRVLRRVAHLVERKRRQTDVFGRWGGEEFLLIAPDLDVEGAWTAAERMRVLIEQSGREAKAPVTASFGATSHRFDDDVESLLKRADDALLEAKQQGRNRVIGRP